MVIAQVLCRTSCTSRPPARSEFRTRSPRASAACSGALQGTSTFSFPGPRRWEWNADGFNSEDQLIREGCPAPKRMKLNRVKPQSLRRGKDATPIPRFVIAKRHGYDQCGIMARIPRLSLSGRMRVSRRTAADALELPRPRPPRLVSADYPRRSRGIAATRLHGLSTSHPRRRDTSPRTIQQPRRRRDSSPRTIQQPRRRRDPSPRNIRVAPAASPRPVSTDYPRTSRDDNVADRSRTATSMIY